MKRTFTLSFIFTLIWSFNVQANKYCNAWGKNDTYGWISEVHIGDMKSSSSWNGKGYHDYTHKSMKCHKGKSYKVNLKPHMKYGHHEKAHWGVWVDWNDDGHFSSHEKMVTGSSYHPMDSWLKVPSHASYGKKRMRVATRWLYAPTACGHYWYGDVHDYTLDVHEEIHHDDHYTPTYCHVKAKNDTYGWIKKVQLGSIDNSTWWNGYKDFCHTQSTKVEPGDNLTLNLMPHIKEQHGWYNNEIGRWKVWVDWDQNGKFDHDEVMVDSSSFDPIDHPFAVPAGAKMGKTRMRVSLRFLYDPKPCGDSWYGDVEDYCIIVGEEEVEEHYENTYCNVYGKNDTYGFIKHVEFGSIDKTSSYGHKGYSDFTHYSTDVSAGSSYKMKLTPWLYKTYDHHTGWYSSQAGYWTVWIDFDHNGKFDSDEKVLWSHSKSSIWKNIHIPHDAKSGKTRMRVAFRFVYWPKACGEYWYGEVEDYTVNIGATGHYGHLVSDPTSAPPQFNDNEQMDIFPNPAVQSIQISTPNQETMDLELYSITGQLIKRIANYNSRNTIELDAISKGSYLAVLQDANGNRYQKKFIKN